MSPSIASCTALVLAMLLCSNAVEARLWPDLLLRDMFSRSLGQGGTYCCWNKCL